MEIKKKSKKIILSNAIIMMVITFIWPFSMFYITVLVAKYLGPEKLGEFSIALNYAAIFKDIAKIGLPVLLLREISILKEKGSNYLVNAFVLGIISSLTAIFVLNGSTLLIGYSDRLHIIIFVFSFSVIFDVLTKYSETAFLAKDKIYIFFKISIISIILHTILTTAFLINGYDLYMLGGIFIFTKIFLLILAVISLHRKVFYLSIKSLDKRVLKSILSFVPIFSLLSILEIFLFRLDIAILSKFFNVVTIGWYSISKKFILFAYFISLSISIAVFPVLIRAFKEKKAYFIYLNEKLFSFVFILGVVMNINLFLLAGSMINLFFGNEYLESVAILEIMSFAVVPIFISTYLSKILIIMNKQKQDLFVVSACIIFLVALYILFYSFFGIKGCSIAFVICFLLLTILRVALVSFDEKELIIKIISRCIKFVLPVLAVIAALFLVKYYSLTIKLISLNFIFIIGIYLNKITGYNDFIIFKNILFNKSKK